MTDEQETVEVPIDDARLAADLCGMMAKSHYMNNETTWGDRYHHCARVLNDATDDEWQDVGRERIMERIEDAATY